MDDIDGTTYLLIEQQASDVPNRTYPQWRCGRTITKLLAGFIKHIIAQRWQGAVDFIQEVQGFIHRINHAYA